MWSFVIDFDIICACRLGSWGQRRGLSVLAQLCPCQMIQPAAHLVDGAVPKLHGHSHFWQDTQAHTHAHTYTDTRRDVISQANKPKMSTFMQVYKNLDAHCGTLDGCTVSRGFGMSGTAGTDHLWLAVAVAHKETRHTHTQTHMLAQRLTCSFPCN